MFTRSQQFTLSIVTDALSEEMRDLLVSIESCNSALPDNNPDQSACVHYDREDLRKAIERLPGHYSIEKIAYEVWVWLQDRAGKLTVTRVSCGWADADCSASFEPVRLS